MQRNSYLFLAASANAASSGEMRRGVDPERMAWSAVGGFVMAAGIPTTIALWQQPASAHIPSSLVCVSGAVSGIGAYVLIAPVARWWPWSSRPVAPLLCGIVLTAIAFFALSGGKGQSISGPRSAHAASTPNYHGTHFSAQIPVGWRMEEDEVRKAGEIESTWSNPSDPSDTLLIDLSPATGLSAEQDAAPVHEQVVQEAGYQEIYYGRGDLTGVESWMWIFRIPNVQRIDYFFTRCSTSFGVLGSTPTSRFSQLRATFRNVAQSVQASCQ